MRCSLTMFVLVMSAALVAVMSARAGAQGGFELKPAVAVEAEDFVIERGWRVVKMGEGNYGVDIIGFSHSSGERFLGADADDADAAAHMDITVPQAGPYRLWVRYEYMPFTETRFRVSVEQGGEVVAQGVVGAKDNLRIAFGQQELTMAQYDPPWGNEGIVEELIEVPALEAGPVRLRLETVEQPRVAGVTAHRFVDCLYLSSDTEDAWRAHYRIPYYRILEAFRDTVGPRYEARYTNRGDEPADFAASHYYNRNPFYGNPEAPVAGIAPGESSAWQPLRRQDTAHAAAAQFFTRQAQPFTVEVRPIGGDVEEAVESDGEPVKIFLPPYPGKGEQAIAATRALDRIIAALEDAPAPGRAPTQPLTYGGFIPYSLDNDYGRTYAKLYALLGMRSFYGIPNDTARKNLEAQGVTLNGRGVTYHEYRFAPTQANIDKLKKLAEDAGVLEHLRWFDYGDEIAFSEWIGQLVAARRAQLDDRTLTVEQVIRPMWQAWLAEHRAGFDPADYWLDAWGELDGEALRPNSTAEAAQQRPRLYVDSLIFYEDTAIAFVAEGAKAVKAAFGEHMLTGANYTVYPFYYPSTVMYVKWFRDGAADFGRHSEYFYQLGNVTPLINGYIAEHFRAGMRDQPQAILRQYTMPHAPGNTDANFQRTAFTHLAHGAKNLDFFGIGMNETFTENYIDFRDTSRFVALRDVTHSMAIVEDVLEASQVVRSDVAMLVSESTERWDWAAVARDMARHDVGPGFRQTRLSYHQDRYGIYAALTFAGCSPDLLIERDMTAEHLADYKVLVIVGDSVPASVLPAVEAWVRAGGVVFATAGVGRFGAYREANPDLRQFVGVASRTIEERDIFMRASQEIPFLKPLGTVRGDGWTMPVLAMHERIEPIDDAEVLATFADDGSPAAIVRRVGEGRVYYTATLPGLGYVWSALQPPVVPDRGPGVHRMLTGYDPGAAKLLSLPLEAAGVSPRVRTAPGLIDARLLRAGDVFVLPLANYNPTVGQTVDVTIRPPDDANAPVKAVSAYHGEIAVRAVDGLWHLSLPALGYGDIVRIETR